MRSNLIEEFKANCVLNILGVIFFIIGFLILNINEGRSAKHHSFLNEIQKEVTIINEASVRRKSPNYEGSIVHYTGEVRVQEALGETNYNLIVQAVKLRKIVEMYQWHEDSTEAKYGDEDGTSRSYYYYKNWSDDLIDSRHFHSLSHQNPRKKPMESKISIAEKVYIGDYEICDEAKDMFNRWTDVTSDTRPDDLYIKMHGIYYYHSDDLFEPSIGDVRVRFQFAGLEGDLYTIVGKFHKGKIVPFTNKAGKKYLLLSKGKLSKDEIFHNEHSALLKELWFTRLFAYILITFFVVSTENLAKVLFQRTHFSFLIVTQHQILSYLKVSAVYTFAICLLRQALHFCGVY